MKDSADSPNDSRIGRVSVRAVLTLLVAANACALAWLYAEVREEFAKSFTVLMAFYLGQKGFSK